MDSITTLFTAVEQLTVAGAVEAFLRAELGEKSPDTQEWYRKRLMGLVSELGESRLLIDVMEVDLLSWSMRLGERKSMYGGAGTRPAVKGGLSPYTLHGYIRAVKRLFKWLTKAGAFDADPSEILKLPTLPKQGRKGISDKNVQAILTAAKTEPRDYALLYFLESTGVRRGGIEDLRFDDLNLESGDLRLRRRATVREKGEKAREVVMSLRALEVLETWLTMRPDIGDDHVFLGHSPGQPWHALSDAGISSIVSRYKRRLKLKGPCSPHQWRHRWFRSMIHHRMPLGQVSQLGGHADVKTTIAFYGQFDTDSLQESYDSAYEDPLE